MSISDRLAELSKQYTPSLVALREVTDDVRQLESELKRLREEIQRLRADNDLLRQHGKTL